MAAIPLGGSAKLNFNINPHPHLRTGIHGARTRHQVSHLQLHFPTTQFSCHCSVSSSPDLTNPTPLLQRMKRSRSEGSCARRARGTDGCSATFAKGRRLMFSRRRRVAASTAAAPLARPWAAYCVKNAKCINASRFLTLTMSPSFRLSIHQVYIP